MRNAPQMISQSVENNLKIDLSFLVTYQVAGTEFQPPIDTMSRRICIRRISVCTLLQTIESVKL